MDWILLGIGILMTTELFLRLPMKRALDRPGTAARKAIAVIGSNRISDHWKEQVLLYYALRIFTGSLMFFLFLAIAFIPIALILLVSEQTTIDTMDLAVSARGLLFGTLLSILYFIIRRRVGQSNVRFSGKGASSAGPGQYGNP